LSDRNVGYRNQQHRNRIGRHIHQAAAVDFFNLLTGPELLEMTEKHLPEHRERLYPPTVALSMFIKQSLEEDRSCQRAVNAWAAQRAAEGLSVQSVRTGAYCRARARLPLEMIVALTRETGRLLSAGARPTWRWRGRCVKLADGTGISMPDTAENQARYPQPTSQAEGVGFPLAGLVGIVCLSTGAVLEATLGAHARKGQSEQDLFRDLLGTLRPGDVAGRRPLLQLFPDRHLASGRCGCADRAAWLAHYGFSTWPSPGQARSCGVLVQTDDATAVDES